jgi:SAM-dependent methyltransferase
MLEKKIQTSDFYSRKGIPGSGDEVVIWHAIDLVAPFIKGKALVIGCGRGAELKVIEELTGIPPVGVDINSGFVEETRSRGYEAYCLDLDQGLPFADGSFDMAYGFAILEHVESPARVLRELHRVLVPQGLLLVRVPNIHFHVENMYYKGTHLYHFTKRALYYTLLTHGFRPQHIFLGPLLPRYVYQPQGLKPGFSFKALRQWLIRSLFRAKKAKTLPLGVWKVLGDILRPYAPTIYAVAVKSEEVWQKRWAPWQEALSQEN